MNKPNNKRKKTSQHKIEETFLQLIQKKNLEDISVSEICKISNINRSTFYASYIDIYDLTEKIKERMELEFSNIYIEDNSGNVLENYLKMFKHIKENQIFYNTYFKLENSTSISPIKKFDIDLAEKFYKGKYIDYHIEFFRAGLNAIIKKWLNNNCKESPEEITEIIKNEYNKKDL